MVSPSRPVRLLRIDVRVSAEERGIIEAAAERSGLTLSGYWRAAVLKAKPLRAARRPVVEIVLLTRALASLGEVAAMLRQLVRPDRESGSAIHAPFLERRIIRELAELAGCRQSLMQALGRSAPAT